MQIQYYYHIKALWEFQFYIRIHWDLLMSSKKKLLFVALQLLVTAITCVQCVQLRRYSMKTCDVWFAFDECERTIKLQQAGEIGTKYNYISTIV